MFNLWYSHFYTQRYICINIYGLPASNLIFHLFLVLGFIFLTVVIVYLIVQ